MSFFVDHPIRTALFISLLLVVVGLIVLIVRAVALVRTAAESQARVNAPVQAISDGLRSAERRVGRLHEHQGDLTETVERIGMRTSELQRLLAIANSSLAVLRAPLKYIGK